MGTIGGPKIFNDYDLSNMLWYIDTSNPDCWDGSAISSDTKFYNLAQTDGSEHFYPYTTAEATVANYELNKSYIERKYGTTGTANTNFRSNVNKQYFTSADTGAISAFAFVKGNIGTSTNNQGAQNIYLGGATGKISFALSGGGTSQWGGVLIYGYDSGGIEHTYNSSANLLNGTWRSIGWSSATTGGTLTTKTYVDAVLTKTDTRSVSDTNNNRLPYGTYTSVMGGWSSGYGEFTGKYNNWMYFNTELDTTDFQQLHNAFKPKFNGL